MNIVATRMKKLSLAKKVMVYFLSVIAVFFIGIAFDLACGPEADPYDYYVSFFHNNVQGQHNYGSFYLSGNYVFDDTEPESEHDINVKEWAAYMGAGVKQEDIKKAMYQSNTRDDSVLVHDHLIAPGKIPDYLKANTFLRALVNGKHDGALHYYLFAKAIEPLANTAYNRWDPVPVDTQKLDSAGGEALKMALPEKDGFIKLRYLYQAERAWHYSGDFEQAMEVYDKYIEHYKSDSHVKGWALALKAGEERHLEDSTKAAYLFSKVFALYPERRVQAYKNFNYCSVNADSVAKLAKNDNERANIYAIDGFSTPELNLSHLQKVYRYAPSSEMVGVLLVREINKLEENYLDPKLNEKLTGNYNFYKPDGADTVKRNALAHLKLLQSFCNKLATDKLYPEPGLGYLGSAYLAWVEGGHAEEGLRTLDKTDGMSLSTKLRDQEQLIKLLLSAQKIKKINEVNEAELLPALKWLDGKVQAGIVADRLLQHDEGWSRYSGNKFATSSRDFYKLVLAEAYLKQGDTVKAALCIMKSENTLAADTETRAAANPAALRNPVDPAKDDRPMINTLPDFWLHYLRSRQVNQLIAIAKGHTGSAYLKFLSAPLSATNNYYDLFDLLGTAYLREHNYGMAVKAYKQIDKGKSKFGYAGDVSELANPFINQLPDYPKVFSITGSKLYDRQMFATKMLRLQQKVVSDPKNASLYYFQMATGLYNASHYGNAYYLISYGWSSFDYGRANRYSYDNDYVKTATAEKYYLHARQLSNNAEFKAQCTFMAAKCHQKQISAPDDIGFGYPNDAFSKAERNNLYFKQLQINYSKTAYYKLAVSECSYLRDFLAAATKR